MRKAAKTAPPKKNAKAAKTVRASDRRPPRVAAKRSRTLPVLAVGSAEPLYRQVVVSLRADIVRGVFPVGSQMPTEGELSERFTVSRHTIREALRHLRADGLIASRQGVGTMVMPPQTSSPFNVHRVASIDELIAYAVESRYVVDSTDVVTSDDPAAVDIELPSGRKWLRFQGFRFDDEPATPPICWTEVFVASEYAGVERMMGRQRGPIWRLIEDMYGERLIEIEQMLLVRGVTPELAKGLRIDAGSSVVEVRRTYKTTSDKVAEVSVNLYPAEKFRFNMKLRRA